MTAATSPKYPGKFTLSVASGKGGTGKTTLAALLARFYISQGMPVRLLDCDVDEPNLNLHFESELISTEPVTSMKPSLDQALCDLCGRCEVACRFNAIIVGRERIFIQEGLCHSCGGCILACPKSALLKEDKKIGVVETYGASPGMDLITGRSAVGETALTKIIRQIRKHESKTGINIIDSPPGTSCSLAASVDDSDYCLVVAEPTEYGLHDMQLLLEALDKLRVPHGVLVNKHGFGNIDIRSFCNEKEIEFIGQIPFDTGFYSSSPKEMSLDSMPGEIRLAFLDASARISEKIT